MTRMKLQILRRKRNSALVFYFFLVNYGYHSKHNRLYDVSGIFFKIISKFIYNYVYLLFGCLFGATHAWHKQILKTYRLSKMT